MKRILVTLLILCQAMAQQPSAPAPTMFQMALPSKQTSPMLIPTSTEDATLIELPYPIEAWSGRGFAIPGVNGTADNNGGPGAVAGDFMLWPGDLRGYKRFTVTPLVEGASRILHVFMEGERTLTLEIFAAERESAFKRVTFVDAERAEAAAAKLAEDERARRTTVTRSERPPESRYVEPSAATQHGLMQFMRALMNMPEDMARRMIEANRYLQVVKHGREISSGEFTISIRFAVRDAITDTLGVCISLKNNTSRRLLFDPQSWIMRAGSQVIPIRTVDFAGVLEPNATLPVFLVVTRGIDGRPTRLLPENDFTIAVTMTGSTSAKPVELIDLNLSKQ